MAKVIRIRLYRVQDYDLFTLYYDKRFRLKRMMVDCLLDYVHGRPLPSYSLKGITWLPKPEELEDGAKTKTGTKFVITTSISVPDDEAEALLLLEDLAANDLVNIFIKGLVRRCFTDMDCLYVSEAVRDKYKDPGVSNRVWVPEPEKREAPARKPAATVAGQRPVKEPAAIPSAPSDTRRGNGNGQPPQIKPTDSVKPKPEPASSTANLFSMADNYSY